MFVTFAQYGETWQLEIPIQRNVQILIFTILHQQSSLYNLGYVSRNGVDFRYYKCVGLVNKTGSILLTVLTGTAAL